MAGRPETRFVEGEHGYLAYQVFGEGDRDIVFVTDALTNMDAIWDEPSAARFLDRLAGMGRVIHFDMLGSGVSDPIPNRTMWLPIEANMRDILTVLDAVGSQRPVVYGHTEGCFFAALLAASHPDRVSKLVLAFGFAKIQRSEDYPIGVPRRVEDVLRDAYVAQHGTTGALLDLTAPSVADDPRFRAWWVRYQRLCIPPGLVRSTWDWFAECDVRAALPAIQAPTLVIGRRDARFHRLEHSEYLAEHIPGARLTVLEGSDTLPFNAGDHGPMLDSVEEFITGTVETTTSGERMLATVMFTDIVDSTGRAAAMGDERWVDLLDEHDRLVRSQLERFGGREVKMTGDGCVATFDGPARAIECGAALVGLLEQIGVAVRVGIHTGEIEIRDGDVGGLAVHIASRVMHHAERGGVLVSSTVKDLVVGAGIVFIDRGAVSLRGVPGEWRLHEVSVARPGTRV